MNNLSIKKISYTYIGFGGGNEDTTQNQISSILNMPINTTINETYNSIVVLNVTNENTSYQFNTLFYIDESGNGSPINAFIYNDTETNNLSTKQVHYNGQGLIGVIPKDTDTGLISNYVTAQQQVAINNLVECVSNLAGLIEDRQNVLGITEGSNANTLLSNVQQQCANAQHIVEIVQEYAITNKDIETIAGKLEN